MSSRIFPVALSCFLAASWLSAQTVSTQILGLITDSSGAVITGAILGLIQGIASFLPIPGLQNVVGLVKAFLRIAVGLVDEVILAHAIRTNATNPWASAQTALVLYAQNYPTMLKNAAWPAFARVG